MHSNLDWWDQTKIEFYERASAHTSFHRTLADEVEKLIKKDESITELGAGLGYVTEILKNDGYDIRAYDLSINAVKRANERAKESLITFADAFGEVKKSDVLLMIFFGSIKDEKDLKLFLDKTKKRLIYILSRHKANPYSTKKDRSIEFEMMLKENKIEYAKRDVTISFNQPLRDEDDAKEFFKSSYKSEIVPPLVNSGIEGYPLLFKNDKEIVIFSIIKGERE